MKTRFIALILLISVILMGVGYAYWSETITITSTITTGELLVEFIDQHRVLDAPYLYHPYSFPQEYTYPDSAKSLKPTDSHTLEAKFEDFFPGLNYKIPFELENNGTIPAQYKNCLVTCDIIDTELSEEEENNLIEELYDNLWVTNLYLSVYNNHGNRTKTIQAINGSTVKLGDLGDTLSANDQLVNLRLEPKNYSGDNKVTGVMSFRFSENFGNDFENRHFIIRINFVWKQFNEV